MRLRSAYSTDLFNAQQKIVTELTIDTIGFHEGDRQFISPMNYLRP